MIEPLHPDRPDRPVARRSRGRAPMLAHLARPPVPSQAAILAELRRVVLAGVVAPGSPIPLDDVAVHLGVSRTPVREALTTLVADGLVEHDVQQGYLVARLVPDELREVYAVRGALEVAALRSAVAYAGPGDDSAARGALDEEAAAIDCDDAEGHHAASHRFHRALVAPSPMPRLRHLLETAWTLTEPVRPTRHVAHAQRAGLHDDHRRLLEAYAARDAERLAALSHAHHDHLCTVTAVGVPTSEEAP